MAPAVTIKATKHSFQVSGTDHGARLDQALAANVPGLSRRKARVLLDIGGVFVNRTRVKVAGRRVRAGQTVDAYIGPALERATGKVGASARAQDARSVPPPTVLFEDEHLVVVSKPAGLLSAPTPESDRNNVVDALSQTRSAVMVVHRLDLHTSGGLVYAKTDIANRSLSEQFRVHSVERQYVAIVRGVWPAELDVVESPVAGKAARSRFEIDRIVGELSVLKVSLDTGRTHQIRIHCSDNGCPVVGDRRYGQRVAKDPRRLALHAEVLGFEHPVTGAPMRFEVPVPQSLWSWLESVTQQVTGDHS